MQKVVLGILLLSPLYLSAQFFSGYYQSNPQMEGFDHFEIKHHQGDEGKYEGVFTLHAFVDHQEMWSQSAQTIHGEEAQYFIEKYGDDQEILSVHKMKIEWDGLEWEFFMLGMLDEHNHGKFIVIEELFNDESESKLISIKKYDWSKTHHLTLRGLVKHR